MKLRIVLIWFILLGNFSVFAKKDFVISILVDVDACDNCEEIIAKLQEIKDDFTIQVLMSEKMESKKEEIYAKYAFNKVGDTILFSDKMYKEYGVQKEPSLHVESIYKIDRYSIDIKDALENGFFEKIKEFNFKTNVLFKENASKAQGFVLAESTFAGKLALYIPNRESIYVYDVYSQELLYEIEIKEEVLKRNFSFNDAGYGLEYYDSLQSSRAQTFGSDGPKKMFFIKDTLCVVLESNYVKLEKNEFGQESRVFTKVYGIAKYVGDSLINLYSFESARVNEKNQEIIANLIFHFYNNNLYSSILTNPAGKNWNHIGVVKFKDNKYQLDEHSINASASVYEDYIHFSRPVFYKNTYALPVIGKIYDIESGALVEHLPFFKDTKKFLIGTLPEMLLQENGIVFNDEYIWVILYNDSNKKKEFYKMNRKTRNFKIAAFSLLSSNKDIIFFDSLNPDYVFYKDRKANMLVRKKVF